MHGLRCPSSPCLQWLHLLVAAHKKLHGSEILNASAKSIAGLVADKTWHDNILRISVPRANVNLATSKRMRELARVAMWRTGYEGE